MAMAIFTQDVCDENGTLINCKYQAYHTEQNKWSDVRDTEDQQYNIDLSDTDWLTLDNSASNNNETVIIAFWVGGDTREGNKERFCAVKYSLDGSDTYTQKVELRPKSKPYARMSLVEVTQVGTQIEAIPTSSDKYSWIFEGADHRHTNYWYAPMFNSVGLLTHRYDWDEGEGYVDSSNNIYNSSGEYNVHCTVSNGYGLDDECEKTVLVKWRAPVVSITADPSSAPLNNTVHITMTVSDPDNRITGKDQLWDGASKGDVFEYDATIAEMRNYVYSGTVAWNDGYESQTVMREGVVLVENINPTTTPEVIKGSGDSWTVYSNAEDPEGRMLKVDYNIYVDKRSIFESTPDGYVWKLLDMVSVNVDPWDLVLQVHKNGIYKAVVVAYDQDGGVSSPKEVIWEVAEERLTLVCNQPYIEWE